MHIEKYVPPPQPEKVTLTLERAELQLLQHLVRLGYVHDSVPAGIDTEHYQVHRSLERAMSDVGIPLFR